MWGRLFLEIMNITGIAALLLLILISVRKLSIKKGVSLGLAVYLGISLAVSTYFTRSPIENLFYTFPNVDSLADYKCEGDIAGKILGETSTLIVSTDKKNSRTNIHTLLALQSGTGYKIGAERDIITTTLFHDPYNIEIIKSKKCEDVYLVIWGIIQSDEVAFSDSLGSHFNILILDQSFLMEKQYTTFCAATTLDEGKLADYSFFVDDSTKRESIHIRMQEDGSFSLTE